MTYGLLNRLTTKPGKRDEVVQHLVESGRVFDANVACLLYLVTSPADDLAFFEALSHQLGHVPAGGGIISHERLPGCPVGRTGISILRLG